MFFHDSTLTLCYFKLMVGLLATSQHHNCDLHPHPGGCCPRPRLQRRKRGPRRGAYQLPAILANAFKFEGNLTYAHNWMLSHKNDWWTSTIVLWFNEENVGIKQQRSETNDGFRTMVEGEQVNFRGRFVTGLDWCGGNLIGHLGNSCDVWPLGLIFENDSGRFIGGWESTKREHQIHQ